MGVEREYKFDVDPDWVAPDLGRPAGGREDLPDENLVSTYFDTPDHRLWSAGVTLRHRAKDGATNGKWTLKLPQSDQDDSGASVRTEVDWNGTLQDRPGEVDQEVADLAGREPLVQLAVLRSQRRRCRLGAPAPWAEVDDDLVTVTSGPNHGMRFRQVEVELLGVPPAGVLEEVLTLLTSAGAVPGGGSKIGMAAGLAPPD